MGRPVLSAQARRWSIKTLRSPLAFDVVAGLGVSSVKKRVPVGRIVRFAVDGDARSLPLEDPGWRGCRRRDALFSMWAVFPAHGDGTTRRSFPFFEESPLGVDCPTARASFASEAAHPSFLGKSTGGDFLCRPMCRSLQIGCPCFGGFLCRRKLFTRLFGGFRIATPR